MRKIGIPACMCTSAKVSAGADIRIRPPSEIMRSNHQFLSALTTSNVITLPRAYFNIRSALPKRVSYAIDYG